MSPICTIGEPYRVEIRDATLLLLLMRINCKLLSESKARCPQIEKIIYRMFMTSHKTVQYSSASNLMISCFPITKVFNYRDATELIAKWAMELGILPRLHPTHDH